jgi:peptide deformylase
MSELLRILEYPDPRLRLSAAPVEHFDAALGTLIDNMFATLYASGGIGLAAPQVGVSSQLLVIDLSGNASDPEVYINPRIRSQAAMALVEESCLSVPGGVGFVKRPTRLALEALDRHGMRVECEIEGLRAVCLHHEMDHLHGRLYIDRLPLAVRWRMRVRSMYGRLIAPASQAAH